MKYQPQHKALQKHIDHYWIIEDIPSLFCGVDSIYAYPGIKPELILPLNGILEYRYLGRNHTTQDNMMFSHIESCFVLYQNRLKSFIIVQFKSRSLSSVQPFTSLSAPELMKNAACKADLVFGEGINRLTDYLKKLPPTAMVAELDDWFLRRLDREKEGFVTEVLEGRNRINNLSEIREKTNYSYSTLERYFKKETGMTPKKFQSLQRYKQAVEEIYNSRNNDWMHYVEKYNYYDQSHFIKEVKRYTRFTPAQLLQIPGILDYRPD